MSVAGRFNPRYTVVDYLRWEGNWELIDGVAIAMTPSPFGNHQRLSLKLANLFFTALAGSACSRCELFYELDWIVDDFCVVRPDLLISCGDKVTEYMERAPVLIVEILSDSSRVKDRTAKFDLYQQQGVKYYLMADPDEKSLEVYQLSGNKYQRVADSQQYEFQLSESCAIEVDFARTAE